MVATKATPSAPYSGKRTTKNEPYSQYCEYGSFFVVRLPLYGADGVALVATMTTLLQRVPERRHLPDQGDTGEQHERERDPQ